MAKQMSGILKVTIAAGKAAASPPLGPALGQRGINIMEFCKDFNDRTKHIITGTPIPAKVAFKNRKYTYEISSPSTTYFLLKAAGIEKGGSKPGREVAGTVTLKQIYEIALIKKQDPVQLNNSLEGICKCIVGSCRSMGLEIVSGKDELQTTT